MSKLHELLAVEPALTSDHNKVHEETLAVFGRNDAFIRQVEEIEYFAEEDGKLNTNSVKEHTTTVRDRLVYTFGNIFTKFVDTLAQRDATNQKAVADLVVDGQVLARNVPGITLLTLEQKLRQKKEELEKVPTLAAGPKWEKDDHIGLYRADPEVTFRTHKTLTPIVLYAATKEHPAQVKEVAADKPVAKITRIKYSGMATSAEKADLIARINLVIQACKRARQRANRTDVIKISVGSAIANFILNGPQADSLRDEEE